MGRVDNIIRRLTDVFNRETTSNNYKLLSLDGEQYDDISDTLDDVRDSHFVSTAIGESLDNIGEIVGLTRQTAETDTQFRARIQARVAGFVGGGTKYSIREAVSVFLGIDIISVDVIDGYIDAGAYGHFLIAIDMNAGWTVIQDWNKLVTLINDVKAAGIYFDGIGPYSGETISMTDSFYQSSGDLAYIEPISIVDDEDILIHRTDITSTDSLNEVL